MLGPTLLTVSYLSQPNSIVSNERMVVATYTLMKTRETRRRRHFRSGWGFPNYFRYRIKGDIKRNT